MNIGLSTLNICILVAYMGVHTAAYKFALMEETCSSNDQLLYLVDGKCYDVLEKGPCEHGEWFVRRKATSSQRKTKMQGICSKKKCTNGSYYWSAKRRCIGKKEEKRLCGASPTVYLGSNDHGEASCMCQKNPPHTRLHGNPTNPCVPLFQRGPCRLGEIVAFPTSYSRAAVCMKNHCHDETVKMKAAGALASEAAMALYKGKCYELNSVGPCPPNGVFQFNFMTRQAGCKIYSQPTLKSIKDIDECTREAGRKCIEVIQRNSSSDDLGDNINEIRQEGYKKARIERRIDLENELNRRRMVQYIDCVKRRKRNCESISPGIQHAWYMG